MIIVDDVGKANLWRLKGFQLLHVAKLDCSLEDSIILSHITNKDNDKVFECFGYENGAFTIFEWGFANSTYSLSKLFSFSYSYPVIQLANIYLNDYSIINRFLTKYTHNKLVIPEGKCKESYIFIAIQSGYSVAYRYKGAEIEQGEVLPSLFRSKGRFG